MLFSLCFVNVVRTKSDEHKHWNWHTVWGLLLPLDLLADCSSSWHLQIIRIEESHDRQRDVSGTSAMMCALYIQFFPKKKELLIGQFLFLWPVSECKRFHRCDEEAVLLVPDADESSGRSYTRKTTTKKWMSERVCAHYESTIVITIDSHVTTFFISSISWRNQGNF
jgi:hypothetical protein